MIQKILALKQKSANPSTIPHAVCTAVAVVISLLIARLLGLPEAHWAPISAFIVTQSTLKVSLSISVQRFVGTAFGGCFGAVVAMFFPNNVVAYGLAVFAIGVFCTFVHADQAAYRYAGIALSIILLIPHTGSPWIPALHRFIEVSLGIVVGLAVTASAGEK